MKNIHKKITHNKTGSKRPAFLFIIILCFITSSCGNNEKKAESIKESSEVTALDGIATFKKGVKFDTNSNELAIPNGINASTYSTDMMTDVTSKTEPSYMKRINRNSSDLQESPVYDVTYNGSEVWNDLKLYDYIGDGDYITCDFYTEADELNILLYDRSDNVFIVVVLDGRNHCIVSSDEYYKCEYNPNIVDRNPLVDAISTPLITPDKICYPTIGGYIYEISRREGSIKQTVSAESLFETLKDDGYYTSFGWIRELGYNSGYYLVTLDLMVDKTVPESAVSFFLIFDSNWNMVAYSSAN